MFVMEWDNFSSFSNVLIRDFWASWKEFQVACFCSRHYFIRLSTVSSERGRKRTFKYLSSYCKILIEKSCLLFVLASKVFSPMCTKKEGQSWWIYNEKGFFKSADLYFIENWNVNVISFEDKGRWWSLGK